MIAIALRALWWIIDRPALAAAIAAPLILGGTWLHGHHTGKTGERAAHEARTAALIEARQADGRRIAALADQLAEAQAERDEAAKELEDAARADAGADNVVLPAGSVLRIDSR